MGENALHILIPMISNFTFLNVKNDTVESTLIAIIWSIVMPTSILEKEIFAGKIHLKKISKAPIHKTNF
jgi:hypothetical protein